VEKNFAGDDDWSYQDIFKRVSIWHQQRLEKNIDPYKEISGHASKATANVARHGNGYSNCNQSDSKPRFANQRGARSTPPTAPEQRCTRCWRLGHHHKNCTAKACGVCREEIQKEASCCPKWEDHRDPNCRFKPDFVPFSVKNQKKRTFSETTSVAMAQVAEPKTEEQSEPTQYTVNAAGKKMKTGRKRRTSAATASSE